MIVGGAGEGLLGKFSSRPTLDTNEALNLLTRTGLAANRKLAQANGISYYEGRKSRDN